MSPVDRQPPAGDDSLAQVIERGLASSGSLAGATLGDFRVERLLGRGGMGEVYLATQMSLSRPAALKVLRSDVLARPGYSERFESEALAVAKLNHPSIVHVYSMAEIDGQRFIAMEYVEGTNLRDYVVRKGALDLRQAFSIMKQAAQAIGAAGEAGIIHRDVKPENILLDRRGRVKVADFGLCRQMDDSGPQITQVGITMGTPAYMSPEQAQGHSLDHRSDLYSLGATFYFMLAATPPFRGDSPVAVALKQVREIPSSLLVHRPDLPVEIDRLVMKLMAKNPADRYQSAAEMLAELARIREAVPLPAPGPADAPDRGMARTEEIAATAAYPTPAIRDREPAPPARVQPAPARAAPSTAAKAEADGLEAAAAPGGPGFSGLIAGAIVAVGLCAGGLAGWAARAPDVPSMPDDSPQRPPALWIEPGWAAIPNKGNAEEQFRHALLAAPRDEWAAAWLAVPGHHPRSHEAASKAYVQLARLWYRRDDVESLAALASGLVAWKDSQKRDKDLAALVLLAIDLKKGDLGAVEKGFEKLSGGEVADLYDASLVALNLEVCTDALRAVQKSGMQTIEEPLRRAFRRLVWQMNRVEMGGPLRAAHPGAATAPRSKG